MHTGLQQPADSDRFGLAIAAVAKRAASTMLLLVVCLMPGVLAAATTQLTAEASTLPASADQNGGLDAKSAPNTVNYPDTNYSDTNSGSITVTSAADLSLFGILALGIIGLLWVRRHTSEL